MPCSRPAAPSAASWGSKSASPARACDDTARTEAITLEADRPGVRLSCPPGYPAPGLAEPARGEPLLAQLADEDRPARGPDSPRDRAGALCLSPGYDVYDPVADRRRSTRGPRGLACSRACRLDVLSDPPRSPSQDCSTSFNSVSQRSGASCAWSLLLAVLAGLLGLAVPVASGILVDQVIPEVDLPGTGTGAAGDSSAFPGRPGRLGRRPPGRRGPDPLADRGKDRAGASSPPSGIACSGCPAGSSADSPSGDLALRAMGLSLIFKKVSGAVVTTLVTGCSSSFNLALCSGIAGGWRIDRPWRCSANHARGRAAMLLACQLRHEAKIRRIEGSIIGFLLELVGGITKLRTAGAENRAFAPLGGAVRRPAVGHDQGAAVLQSAASVLRGLPDRDRDGHLPGRDPSRSRTA